MQLCGPRAEIEANVGLHIKEDFRVLGGGISGLGQLWEVWITKNGKWAIVETSPNISEDACIMAGNDQPGSWHQRMVEKTEGGNI